MNRSVFERYVQELCEDLATKQNTFAHKQRHACVLTYNDAVISSGVNVNLKNDFVDLYNPLKCIHAESLAIMRAISRHHNILNKCELWVCRKGKTNCYSRPCPMCTKIIQTFGIDIVHYTINDGTWVTEYFS